MFRSPDLGGRDEAVRSGLVGAISFFSSDAIGASLDGGVLLTGMSGEVLDLSLEVNPACH